MKTNYVYIVKCKDKTIYTGRKNEGTDMDMVSCGFLNTLEESLKEAKARKEKELLINS